MVQPVCIMIYHLPVELVIVLYLIYWIIFNVLVTKVKIITYSNDEQPFKCLYALTFVTLCPFYQHIVRILDAAAGHNVLFSQPCKRNLLISPTHVTVAMSTTCLHWIVCCFLAFSELSLWFSPLSSLSFGFQMVLEL